MGEMAKSKENGLLKGAAWIAAGGFIAKVIGAIYRIPLTNLIGGKGLGLYQLVYPAYCLLLTVSATGIPSSIAKLTAERIRKGQSPRALFASAMKLFLLIGAGGTAILAIIAPFLAKAQGSGEVLWGYYALAPSVLLVSAISVFRGYFQGKNDMMPTALSEIAEQVIKVAFGLLFAYLFRERINLAVIFLLLAVSLSELFTLFLMLALYRRDGEKRQNDGGRVAFKGILRMSIPVTFLSLLIPLSSLIDSVLAVRILSGYERDAVTLYGLFAGGAVTVVGLPVSVCYGIAAATIPRVSAETDGRKARKKIFQSLGLTALLSGVSAIGLYLFAEPAVRIIYAKAHLVVGNVAGIMEPAMFTEGRHKTEIVGDVEIHDTMDGDFSALCWTGDRFAFAYGHSREDVLKLAEEGMQMDLDAEEAKKLAFFEKHGMDENAPHADLYAKCLSVMKTQLYSPEAQFKTIWSTPDRLPHKSLWLWDSVFHALGHRNIDAKLAEDLIRA
ncbi:MAG: oligosaccharide flippase family protein, partial [Clostridia bacterium]|nr:oligosaccharide flippase family protein [Clostridia bacterium]